MRNEIIEAGMRYQHFKGSIMEVVLLAKDSENLEKMVVYKHDEEFWVRPLSNFLSDEDVRMRSDNVTGQKYRFEKID